MVHISKLGRLPKFSRDQAGDDVLFEAVYNHVGGSNCTSCDNAKKLQREVRIVDTPEIHYGTIASGNQVIRNGATRDQISSLFQTYCTALIFAPATSIIRKQFKDCVPQWI